MGCVRVEDWLKGGSVVCRLPDTVGRERDVDNVWILLHGGYVVDATAHARRPDAAPDETLQQRIGRPVDRSWCRAGTRARGLRGGWSLSLSGLVFRTDSDGEGSHSKNDHNQQAKIVNGARPV